MGDISRLLTEQEELEATQEMQCWLEKNKFKVRLDNRLASNCVQEMCDLWIW